MPKHQPKFRQDGSKGITDLMAKAYGDQDGSLRSVFFILAGSLALSQNELATTLRRQDKEGNNALHYALMDLAEFDRDHPETAANKVTIANLILDKMGSTGLHLVKNKKGQTPQDLVDPYLIQMYVINFPSKGNKLEPGKPDRAP